MASATPGPDLLTRTEDGAARAVYEAGARGTRRSQDLIVLSRADERR